MSVSSLSWQNDRFIGLWKWSYQLSLCAYLGDYLIAQHYYID